MGPTAAVVEDLTVTRSLVCYGCGRPVVAEVDAVRLANGAVLANMARVHEARAMHLRFGCGG